MALGTRHSALGTRHSALGTRHSALGTRHSALGTRHSASEINTRRLGVAKRSRFVSVNDRGPRFPSLLSQLIGYYLRLLGTQTGWHATLLPRSRRGYRMGMPDLVRR